MIHIIVYSTTNTAAKMYKKKKKKRKGKSHFKVTQEDDNGWTLVIHLKRLWESRPNSL
jgi:hypothetical protein